MLGVLISVWGAASWDSGGASPVVRISALGRAVRADAIGLENKVARRIVKLPCQTVKGILVKMADNGSSAQCNDRTPDIRDGLTREERVVLYVLHETQKERGDRNVPTAMLWGRVCEHFYISPDELSLMLARLGARK